MLNLPKTLEAQLTATGQYGESAQNVSKNTHKEYFKMLNAKGREVPVPVPFLQDMLRRGYAHTDQKIYSDDPSLRTPSPLPPQSSNEVIAELVKNMAAQNNLNELAVILKEDPSIAAELKELLKDRKAKKQAVEVKEEKEVVEKAK